MSKSPHFDASIILNVHREAVFLRRTLLSLAEAVRVAVAAGLKIELVVVLDRSDDETREALRSVELSDYAATQIIEVDNGSLGLSRNDGIDLARGEYLLMADADDLISDNYLVETIAYAKANGENALYFPQYMFGFGTAYYIYIIRDLTEVTPLSFVDMHPYVSRVCAHRTLFEKMRYEDLRVTNGYAYEDWHFNAEAIANGIDIKAVPGIILFYRQRSGSLVRAANSTSVRQISPTKLFEPTTYLSVSADSYKVASDMAETWLRSEPANSDFLHDRNIIRMLLAANAIEPGISPSRYDQEPPYTNAASPLEAGITYYKMCDIVRGRRFRNVALFPFISRGGAEKYLLELLHELYRQDPLSDFLIILGENYDGPSWASSLPPNAVLVDIGLLNPTLEMSQRCLLALKLIEATAPGSRLHMRESPFADAFLSMFRPILSQFECVYYRFNDNESAYNGEYQVINSPVGLISENIEILSKIVCDSKTMVLKDFNRIGIKQEKWNTLYARIDIVDAPSVLRRGGEFRLLWASRIDAQKRPDLLPHLADSLRARNPNFSIDVYGSSVFGNADIDQLEGLENLKYKGPYDGFYTLPYAEYEAFVYTSWCDGIPNTLLEAMSVGIPIIAPDVGGVAELIVNNETGLLLPSIADNKRMAASYVDAIIRITEEPGLRERLVSGGQRLLRERHSAEAYARRVAEIYSNEKLDI